MKESSQNQVPLINNEKNKINKNENKEMNVNEKEDVIENEDEIIVVDENELINENENPLEKYIKIIKNYKKSVLKFDESTIQHFMSESKKIINQKKKIKKQKEKLKLKLENIEKEEDFAIIKLRDNYIKEKQGKKFNICIHRDLKTISLIILSAFHFLFMLEIHGILFALFREIKRTIYFMCTNEYSKNDTKTFFEYLSSSSINDSSKINFNYITSFLSDLFIAKISIKSVYTFSLISSSIIISIFLIFDFLSIEQLKNKENYSKTELTIFIIVYIIIYIIASLVSLYPLALIQKLENNNFWAVTIMTGILTSSVCVKNYLLTWDWYINFKWSHNIIMICGLIFAIYLWIYNNSLNGFYIDDIEKQKYEKNEEEDVNKETEMKGDKIKEEETKEKEDDKKVEEKKEDDKKEEEKKEEDKDKDKESKTEKKKNEDDKKVENKIIEEVSLIKEGDKFPADYIFGYLVIKSDFSNIVINIKGFGGYLCSILKNKKFLLLIFINFFSRAQKLKFKTDYKIIYDKHIHWLTFNFIFSYILYIIIIIYIFIFEKYIIPKFKNKNKKNNNIEDKITEEPKEKDENYFTYKERNNNIIINKNKNTIINIRNKDNSKYNFSPENNSLKIDKGKNSKLNIKNYSNIINIDNQNNISIKKGENSIIHINHGKNMINFESKNKSNLFLNNINNDTTIINIDNKNNININNNLNINFNNPDIDDNININNNINNNLQSSNDVIKNNINKNKSEMKINEFDISTSNKNNNEIININSNSENENIEQNKEEKQKIKIENQNNKNDEKIIVNIDKMNNIRINRGNNINISIENPIRIKSKKKKEYKNDESFDNSFREKAIIICIMIDDILMFIFSFISFFKRIEFFIYFSIVISGAFNFLLYDYFSFSTASGEYLTLSGIISISQSAFRILELFDTLLYLDYDFWYFIQSFFSISGVALCIWYLYEIGFFNCKCRKEISKDSQNIKQSFITSNSLAIN